MFSKSSIVVLVLGVSYSAGSVIPALLSRQEDMDIPSACNSACSGVVQTLDTCGANNDFNCICQQSVTHAYAQCMSCLVHEADGDFSESDAQDATDELISNCASLGFNLPAEEVDGDSGSALSISTTGAGGMFTVLVTLVGLGVFA